MWGSRKGMVWSIWQNFTDVAQSAFAIVELVNDLVATAQNLHKDFGPDVIDVSVYQILYGEDPHEGLSVQINLGFNRY